MIAARPWFLAAALGFLLVPLPVHANVVHPGETVSPEVFTVTSIPPHLGQISGTFSIGSGQVTGRWQQVVLVDPLGVTCAGCLDFAYQLSNDPSSLYPIFAVNLARYFDFATNAGYVHFSDPDIGSDGDTAPVSVTRAPAGGQIGFSFATAAAVISPGYNSPWLVVATNATAYDSRGMATVAAFNFTSQTNITTQISGLYEPSGQAAPEPSAVVLLSLGVLGIAVFRFARVHRHLRSVSRS